VLVKNKRGIFVALEDKIFHVESNRVFNTGPVSEEELKEIMLTSNYVVFRKNGFCHRNNDLPAVVCADGAKEWHQNGQLHRDNDLPAITYESESQVLLVLPQLPVFRLCL